MIGRWAEASCARRDFLRNDHILVAIDWRSVTGEERLDKLMIRFPAPVDCGRALQGQTVRREIEEDQNRG